MERVFYKSLWFTVFLVAPDILDSYLKKMIFILQVYLQKAPIIPDIHRYILQIYSFFRKCSLF